MTAKMNGNAAAPSDPLLEDKLHQSNTAALMNQVALKLGGTFLTKTPILWRLRDIFFVS